MAKNTTPSTGANSAKTIGDIQTEDDDIITLYSTRDSMFSAFHDMYFMQNSEGDSSLNDHDASDVKQTISPSARNDVVGVHRLLKTSDPRFKATSQTGDTDKLVKASDEIYGASCELLPTSVHSDATLSAVLFGMVTIRTEMVDDLLALDLDPVIKTRLQDIRMRTPVLFTAISAQQSYPKFGKYGMIAFVRQYDTTAGELREEWGPQAVPNHAKDTEQLTVRDHTDGTYRAVYVKGESDPVEPKAFGPHGLKRIPIVCTLAGGSGLFFKPEETLMPFLYAKWQGQWWRRETLLYTTLFTSMFERGTGPLVSIDPTSLDENQQVMVNWSGALRYITGKAQLIDDKAFDDNLVRAKSLLDNVGDDSTIYKQALGAEIGNGNAPFSAVAMLSQSGKLPIIDQQEAVSKAIEEAMMISLRRMKDESIPFEGVKSQTPLLNPQDIPDDMALECTLEPNLPQDQVKNSQIANGLGDTVSTEWKRKELLQVNDSDAMTKQIWTEKASNQLFYQLVNNPSFIQKFLSIFTQLNNPTQVPNSQVPKQLPPDQQTAPASPNPPAPMPPANTLSTPQQVGGPQAAAAGGAIMPAVEPQQPGQNMGGG